MTGRANTKYFPVASIITAEKRAGYAHQNEVYWMLSEPDLALQDSGSTTITACTAGSVPVHRAQAWAVFLQREMVSLILGRAPWQLLIKQPRQNRCLFALGDLTMHWDSVFIFCVAIGSFVAALIARRNQQKYSSIEVIMYSLLGFEWLYFAYYVGVVMYHRDINQSHLEVIRNLVYPLLTVVPFLFYLSYKILRRLSQSGK